MLTRSPTVSFRPKRGGRGRADASGAVIGCGIPQEPAAHPRPERRHEGSLAFGIGASPMSYELQVYAQSPVLPTPRELLARAGESGLAVELRDAPGARTRADATSWSKLLIASGDAERGGFLVEDSADLDKMKQQFREDLDAGEDVPDEVLEARRLYVLELDDESDAGEDHQAAFVVAAWALAALTEGIVFDPQEEFFADAESFWAILMDESLADEGCGDDGEPEDDGAIRPAGLHVLPPPEADDRE